MFRFYSKLTLISIILGLSGCSTTSTKDDPAEMSFNQQLFQKAKSAYLSGDFKTAATLFDSLAQNGNHEAQYSLGYMYYYSKGVNRDLNKAIYWFKLAASQGNSNAKQALLTINNRIAEQNQTNTLSGGSAPPANTPPGVIDLRSNTQPKATAAPVSPTPDVQPLASSQPSPAPMKPAAATIQNKQPTQVTTATPAPVKKTSYLSSTTDPISKNWIMQQPDKNYTIQMSSSSIAANAQRLQKKLKANNSHIFRAKVKDDLRYTVIYGSYDSYTKARQQQQTFKSEGYRDTWIRSIESIKNILR